ncbi:hypothetical protein LUU34_01047100 [Aix galericulata]|nr:hypothetical protein LUU34_01047100 [Aix galericulata]
MRYYRRGERDQFQPLSLPPATTTGGGSARLRPPPGGPLRGCGSRGPPVLAAGPLRARCRGRAGAVGPSPASGPALSPAPSPAPAACAAAPARPGPAGREGGREGRRRGDFQAPAARRFLSLFCFRSGPARRPGGGGGGGGGGRHF